MAEFSLVCAPRRPNLGCDWSFCLCVVFCAFCARKLTVEWTILLVCWNKHIHRFIDAAMTDARHPKSFFLHLVLLTYRRSRSSAPTGSDLNFVYFWGRRCLLLMFYNLTYCLVCFIVCAFSVFWCIVYIFYKRLLVLLMVSTRWHLGSRTFVMYLYAHTRCATGGLFQVWM